jgi:hypothetical protein
VFDPENDVEALENSKTNEPTTRNTPERLNVMHS